jgi:hypothetical protein
MSVLECNKTHRRDTGEQSRGAEGRRSRGEQTTSPPRAKHIIGHMHPCSPAPLPLFVSAVRCLSHTAPSNENRSNHRPLLFILALTLALFTVACERVLIDERFHDSRLTNWTAIDDADTVEEPSVWRVEQDGWLHQRSNIWGRRGDFIGRWYGTFLVAGDEGWSDYTITLKAKPEDDDGFGVVFRFTDPEHFYRLVFLQDGFSGGPVTRLDKRAGEDYTELWSARQGYRVGLEMSIRIDVEGDLIKASVDGHDLLEVKDDTYRRGKVGLFCYAQNGQAFDDIKVILK